MGRVEMQRYRERKRGNMADWDNFKEKERQRLKKYRQKKNTKNQAVAK